MLREATSPEIINAALSNINDQYNKPVEDIDTSILIESALMIASESHNSEQAGTLQLLAHSVCNYALTIERAKFENNEISNLLFACDEETEENADAYPEHDDEHEVEPPPSNRSLYLIQKR